MKNQENIKTLLKFMPASQAQCFIEGLMRAEYKYFEDVADKLANVIKSAPVIYETATSTLYQSFCDFLCLILILALTLKR